MLRRLLILNGIAIVAVVMNHSTFWSDIAMFWWTDQYLPVSVPDYSQWGSLTHQILYGIRKFTATFAVPVFLFTSGYFIAYAYRGNQKTFFSKVIRTRLQNLLIPYTIWSIAIFLIDILFGVTFTPLQYLLLLGFGLAATAYYYVFVLAQLLLFSPFLAALAKKKPLTLIGTAVLIRFLGVLARIYFGPILIHFNESTSYEIVFFDSFLIFFSIGLIFGFHQTTIKTWLERRKGYLLVSIPAFYILSFFEANWIIQNLGPTESFLGQSTFSLCPFTIGLILAFLTFETASTPFSALLTKFGKNSFSIYLLHQPILKISAKVIYHVSPFILGDQLIFQALLIASAIGFPILATNLLDRSLARASHRILFG